MFGQSFNYLLKEMSTIGFIWLCIGMLKANVHINSNKEMDLLDFHGTPIDALNLYICFVLLDIGSGLFYIVFDSWSHLKLEVAKLYKTENKCVINTMYVMASLCCS